eukprot:TRINITY_DN13378_c0_g1_i3.p1 TRINITY_DN13378_c0_g1~~TRINITY_DN13378_c0_g1_i3.p1  ORF type:complete len:353 (-),score=47.37 TRINITY_DN13378_c0_g1_i3:60-1061(-)
MCIRDRYMGSKFLIVFRFFVHQFNRKSMPPEETSHKKYSNTHPSEEKSFTIFKEDLSWYQLPDRMIYINEPDYKLPNNRIRTTKYTFWGFLPMNLLEQFSKLANVYFLLNGILQMIPELTTSEGQPLIFIPLITIVLISAVKDLFEDLKRYKSDKEENHCEVEVFIDQQTSSLKRWTDLHVGDIIKVNCDKYCPADILLLSTSNQKNGVCYIETKNLDGETNLKQKQVAQNLREAFPNTVFSKNIELNYEKPNPYLHQFKGSIKLPSREEEIPLDNTNVILRGCSLRNTEWVYGCVLYTGHHSKVMLNSVTPRQKIGKVERAMERYILSLIHI